MGDSVEVNVVKNLSGKGVTWSSATAMKMGFCFFL